MTTPNTLNGHRPDVREIARGLVREGRAPIPVPPRSKGPTVSNWQNLRLTEAEIALSFASPDSNLGVLMGEPSGGLYDVDLDCAEVCQLAPLFLPATHRRFGRDSKPASHWLYIAEESHRTIQFFDPTMKARGNREKAMLVELRGTGGQTIWPGSLHPDGELIRFDEDGEAGPVVWQELHHVVARLAVAGLLVRHWPTGGRHHCALYLAGWLTRNGLSDEDVTSFVAVVGEAAGDDEIKDRLRASRDAIAQYAGRGKTGGLPKLATLLGDPIVAAISAWMPFPAPAGAKRLNLERARGAVEEHTAYELNDTGNGKRFADRYRGTARYVAETKRWHLYEGGAWRPDRRGHIVEKAKQVVYDMRTELAEQARDERAYQAMSPWVRESGDMDRLQALLRAAASEPDLATVPEEFDSDPYLVNLLDGTVRLHLDGGASFHEHNPEDLCSQQMAAHYVPGARNALWESTLRFHLPEVEERAFLARCVAYCLTGLEKEHLFVGHGPTKGGKSTIMGAIRNAFGSYAAPLDIETLRRDRNPRPGAPRPDLVALHGKRFVLASEIDEETALSPGLIKSLTGGDARTERDLFQGMATSRTTYAPWVIANDQPKLPAHDQAIWERVLLIPFLHQRPPEERDQQLRDQVKDPAITGDAILQWILEGWRDYCARGRRLDPPQVVQQATGAYRESMDGFREFFEDRLVFESGVSVLVETMDHEYGWWKEEHQGTGKVSRAERQAMEQALVRHGCQKKQPGNVTVDGNRTRWFGVRVSEKAPPSPTESILAGLEAKLKEANR